MSLNAKPLLTIKLDNEYDVILARRRARQIAFLINLSEQDQIRVATATSEIARNALQHAHSGTVHFVLDDIKTPINLRIAIADKGEGFKDLDSVLGPDSQGAAGIAGVKRLVDKLTITSTEKGSTVTLLKKLPHRKLPFSVEETNRLSQALAEMSQENPLEEVYAQNHELLRTFEVLKLEQTRLAESEQRYRTLSENLEQTVADRTSLLVTALKEAQEAHAVKSQFVANISHEIRTPLTSVVGMAEILTHDNELSGASKETAQQLFDSSKQLLTLFNDLLDFARLEAKKIVIEKREFDLVKAAQSVVSLCLPQAKEKQLQINLTLSESAVTRVVGDESRFRQVLLNLIQNAIKFTHAGGVEVTIERLGTLARVSVADTGIGISQEAQSKIFNPFEQAHEGTHRLFGGTGLGLSISKELVILMGGDIGVFSEEGKGSIFWFTLPVAGIS